MSRKTCGDSKLSIKLHERLGDEAMTELLSLFADLGAETRAEFQEVRAAYARLERQTADLRADLTQQVADLRADMARQIGSVREELAPKIAGVQAELIKWTFLSWLGTIGIVLLLIRFPP